MRSFRQDAAVRGFPYRTQGPPGRRGLPRPVSRDGGQGNRAAAKGGHPRRGRAVGGRGPLAQRAVLQARLDGHAPHHGEVGDDARRQDRHEDGRFEVDLVGRGAEVRPQGPRAGRRRRRRNRNCSGRRSGVDLSTGSRADAQARGAGYAGETAAHLEAGPQCA